MKISAIIPAYNRENLLGMTVNCLLRQTRPPDEIIVVDDGSTDSTRQVAESFGNPVKVLSQKNSGPAAARNLGLAHAQGEMVLFFDSDDLLIPSSVESLMLSMENAGSDIAYGPWIKGAISAGSFVPENQVLQQQGLPQGGSLTYWLLSAWSVISHTALFHRRILEKIGGFPEQFWGVEDQAVFLNSLLHGATVSFAPDSLVLYRTGNEGKLTGSGLNNAMRFKEWISFLLYAREQSLEKGATDPLNWLGYRMRLWQATQDLEGLPELSEWKNRSLELLGRKFSHKFYPFLRFFYRVMGGLQVRLVGGRAPSCFRIGPLNVHQIQQIESLGLSVDISTQQTIWKPQFQLDGVPTRKHIPVSNTYPHI
ncbi:MAG: glycosyltransferase family 2 protein [Verrucomicrobiae bacterium]|nr:glycosyltransferase family 2 protein [Verrucomicrobiae bacterium]